MWLRSSATYPSWPELKIRSWIAFARAGALHEGNAPLFEASLIDVVLPLVPDLTASLTRGVDVLEVGCGTGDAMALMAKHFPKSRFVMSGIKASSHLEKNIDHPIGPFGYGVSCMHCMPVSLAYDGMGLGAMWGEEKAKEMIGEAGMDLVDVKEAEGDPFNNFYIARKA